MDLDQDLESPEKNVLLETVLEGLMHACLLVDGTDRILFSNEAAKSLFMPKGRLLGRKLETVLADRQLSQLVSDCFVAGRSGSLACALRLPGEAWRDDRHFLVEAVPLLLSAERRLVRLALRPDEQADADAKVVPNPAADVLVQLRGPLTVVQGYLENLLDGMITDPVALRQSLLTMRRSTIQIERILENLRQ
jgi:two-component system OmpR family sensor kinase/two-component system phosphate regulon sensor histidine kinase PhoR